MSETAVAPMNSKVQAYGFEEVLNIHYTNDLSIFQPVKGNRPPNPRHISNLRKSLRKYGMLKRVILVNGDYGVIDGQHRLEAAKAEGEGVYYIILEDYGLNEVHVLNLNMKNWNQRAFLNGYADMGYLDYTTLRSLVRENKDFTLTDIRKMCSNTHLMKKLSEDELKGVRISAKAFKEGEWTLLSLQDAELQMERLRKIKPYYAGYNRSNFVTSMIDMFNKPEFNFKTFLKKLKIQPLALVDQPKISQYKELIEEIYNYKNQNKVNLRF